MQCSPDGLQFGVRFELGLADDDHGRRQDVQADATGNDLRDDHCSVSGCRELVDKDLSGCCWDRTEAGSGPKTSPGRDCVTVRLGVGTVPEPVRQHR